MRRSSWTILSVFVTVLFAIRLLPQTTTSTGQPPPPQKKAAPSAPRTAAPAAMTNRDVIRLLQAKISEDIIITKIKQSKTKFDTSIDGLVILRGAGASARLIALMMAPDSDPGAPT